MMDCEAFLKHFFYATFDAPAVSRGPTMMDDGLLDFVENHGLPWPEYFDGHDQIENQFTRMFGIDGLPTMFLIDRQGRLRSDALRSEASFEEQIAKLLEER